MYLYNLIKILKSIKNKDCLYNVQCTCYNNLLDSNNRS